MPLSLWSATYCVCQAVCSGNYMMIFLVGISPNYKIMPTIVSDVARIWVESSAELPLLHCHGLIDKLDALSTFMKAVMISTDPECIFSKITRIFSS